MYYSYLGTFLTKTFGFDSSSSTKTNCVLETNTRGSICTSEQHTNDKQQEHYEPANIVTEKGKINAPVIHIWTIKKEQRQVQKKGKPQNTGTAVLGGQNRTKKTKNI